MPILNPDARSAMAGAWLTWRGLSQPQRRAMIDSWTADGRPSNKRPHAQTLTALADPSRWLAEGAQWPTPLSPLGVLVRWVGTRNQPEWRE